VNTRLKDCRSALLVCYNEVLLVVILAAGSRLDVGIFGLFWFRSHEVKAVAVSLLTVSDLCVFTAVYYWATGQLIIVNSLMFVLRLLE